MRTGSLPVCTPDLGSGVDGLPAFGWYISFKFKHGGRSRSGLEIVKLEPASCRARARGARACNSPDSSLGLVESEPGTCHVRACNLSRSTPGACPRPTKAWHLHVYILSRNSTRRMSSSTSVRLLLPWHSSESQFVSGSRWLH